ncbi:hypothetical protein R1sor_008122 [Riccia sorocarpa]|uniref:Protein EXORDIUM-like 2 n=1 Tax=Riccia sorocarpa TaxID=122646 RepID=A0ABD3HU46_9MARC
MAGGLKLMTLLRISLAVSLVLIACTLLPKAEAVNKTRHHAISFCHPKCHPAARLKHLHNKNRGFGLVAEPTIILDYHFGPVLSGKGGVIKINVVYYGSFTVKQRSILRTFFSSFGIVKTADKKPTVGKWWQITKNYVDLYNHPVGSRVILGKELVDSKYSFGKTLTQADIQKIVIKSLNVFGTDARSIYLVLTSPDVEVEKFCMNVCGTHFYTFPSDATKSQMLPYGWVGNPKTQCPEFCSWPYAAGGLLQKPLTPPNGDSGIDGMIITIANLLAGISTNPYGNAYYQADGLESAGVCQGIYGQGAFPGYPGELLTNKRTGASYNVVGLGNSQFLVPNLWDPPTQQCTGQAK